jgi:hypothetical protein
MHATRQISRRTTLKATGVAAVGLASVATPSVAVGGALHGRQGEGRRRALHRRVREADRQPAFTERLHGPAVAIVYRGVELRPRSTWPQNNGMTRQPVRILFPHG